MSTQTIDINTIHLSREHLLSLIHENKEVILTKDSKPLARIIPITDVATTTDISPQPGLNPGAIWTSDDFDESLPDEFWMGEE
jgi:antitoxin (DNA-binding transcriptional repressor) of toxin-antitoxin stability system